MRNERSIQEKLLSDEASNDYGATTVIPASRNTPGTTRASGAQKGLACVDPSGSSSAKLLDASRSPLNCNEREPGAPGATTPGGSADDPDTVAAMAAARQAFASIQRLYPVDPEVVPSHLLRDAVALFDNPIQTAQKLLLESTGDDEISQHAEYIKYFLGITFEQSWQDTLFKRPRKIPMDVHSLLQEMFALAGTTDTTVTFKTLYDEFLSDVKAYRQGLFKKKTLKTGISTILAAGCTGATYCAAFFQQASTISGGSTPAPSNYTTTPAPSNYTTTPATTPASKEQGMSPPVWICCTFFLCAFMMRVLFSQIKLPCGCEQPALRVKIPRTLDTRQVLAACDWMRSHMRVTKPDHEHTDTHSITVPTEPAVARPIS